MLQREINLTNRQCRQDAANLLMMAALYDKRPGEKPGEFYNRIKSRLQHPEKLTVIHFPHFMGKS